jgi:hypothetical protein
MQLINSSITHSVNASQKLVASQVANQTVKGAASFEQAAVLPVGEREKTRIGSTLDEKNNQPKPSQALESAQVSQDFVLDETKLALVERYQQSNQINEQQSNQSNSQQVNNQQVNSPASNDAALSDIAFNSNNANLQSFNSSSPSNQQAVKEPVLTQNQAAVSTYNLIDNLAQRESVQKIFGVDLFA